MDGLEGRLVGGADRCEAETAREEAGWGAGRWANLGWDPQTFKPISAKISCCRKDQLMPPPPNSGHLEGWLDIQEV